MIEQFRPGVMQRLGLDYQTLSEINPRLIYCSITGYGQTGGYQDKAGHDINYVALSGIAGHSWPTAQWTTTNGDSSCGYMLEALCIAVIGILARSS